MADPVSYGNSERDVEQALIALKKGTQLIKYSRKGKPKLCPFRISTDETKLIWYSHGDERNLKISSVTRIIPGQRTPVFRRYLRPEKDYLSFSLIYNGGERSLDLICKDKAEAEVWFAGLKALISAGSRSRRTKSDISDSNDSSSDYGRPFGAALEFTKSIVRNRPSFDSSRDSFECSDVGSDRAIMQLRTSTGDGFRLSVSSTPSSSSQGSGPDDIEALGDVYVWGEVWSDGVAADGSVSPFPMKTDALVPKPLETSVVLDVHQIACGVRHFALVTRQGEVFTWGEDNGGVLGHGIDRSFSRPHLVEYLAVTNIDSVSCGEYHTCAVSSSGDLFSWGDGSANTGLLGHGTDVSHWIPKRVSGPLEGLQVLSVACGTWHSALATSNGKLFTFGDGTFGALGHGSRESSPYPREVQSLNGLKTLKVACGTWHTAAIVEVMNHTGSNASSRKLFTWGDGDKYRLGHGKKEIYFLPTCVSALIEYSFHQIACGNSMTVALTTSGHVFTMGNPAHGQLGSPQTDGKMPFLIQEKLIGEFVEEISCGANHVAILTSRSEVFTWGKGENGRLGHGDQENRVSPTLVEALKDRHVKSISCGSNFTACICTHKWVSGADQSMCSGCRQAFGFTRKRHNCYNCGLVHCHACSSKKAMRAALAPTPGKPHRVCDSCYSKLKASEAGNASNLNRKNASQHQSMDMRYGPDRMEARTSRLLLSPQPDSVRYEEPKPVKTGTKAEPVPAARAPQVPGLYQLKDIAFPSSLSAIQNALRPVYSTTPPPPPIPPQPPVSSRPSSPYSRRPSPPRSTTQVFSRGVLDSLKKTNELLNQEVKKLQNQVKTMKQKCDARDVELQRLHKNVHEAASLATHESSKSLEAKDIVQTIATQLKELSEKLPPEISESETFKSMNTQVEGYLDANKTQGTEFSSSLATTLDQNKLDEQLDAVSDLSQNDEPKMPMSHTRHASIHSSEISSRAHEASIPTGEGEKLVNEQFEPGVYVTLIQLRNGVKIFKRVRFSKRRFDEHQAEDWWKENKDRLLKRYSVPSSSSNATSSGEEKDEAASSSQL